jgi:competence protein ComEA
MENFKTFARWAAIAIGAIALAFAFVAPRRSDTPAAPDDSPPPAVASVSAAPSTPVATATPASIAVYVCGAVRRPGVVELSAGSRIVDAVREAGGLSKDADDEAVNLAQPVVDGMKVDVPRKGAHVDAPGVEAGPVSGSEHTSSSRGSRHRSSGRSGSHKLQPGQTLDINTASEAELTQLPGVGPSLARRIVEYRQANGPFATIDDLQNVSGVGPSKFAKMQPYVRT